MPPIQEEEDVDFVNESKFADEELENAMRFSGYLLRPEYASLFHMSTIGKTISQGARQTQFVHTTEA